MLKEKCAYDGCQLRPHDESGLCILHSPKPKKDAKEFNTILQYELARQEDDADVKMINLEGVVFPEGAIWDSAGFDKDLSFRNARFLKLAGFNSANLAGFADFSGAEAHDNIYFLEARFQKGAAFRRTLFHGETHFSKAQFCGKADFTGAQFDGEADFLGAEFSNDVDFFTASFRGGVRFHRAAFPAGRAHGVVNFCGVTLEQPEKVFFEHVTLSHTSLLYTDMSCVNLTDVKWPRRPRTFLFLSPARTEKVFGPEYVLHDHQVLMNKPKQERDASSCRLVENLYRQLRVNLESRGQNIEAGDFHVGEMEMRRLNPDTHRLYQWLLWVYRLLGNYGESYGRPLFWWLVLAFVIFAPLYLFSGFKVMEESVQYQLLTWDPQWAFPWHLVQAWAAALAVPPLIQPDFHLTSSWVAPFRFLNSLINLTLVALALIAFRRRFKR